MIFGTSRLWECFCIFERGLLSTREKCHATCCYSEEDLPNLAVFVHALDVERREAGRANNSSSFVARSLIIVTPWWQSDSKHDEIHTSIYSKSYFSLFLWVLDQSLQIRVEKKLGCFCTRLKILSLQVQAGLFQHLQGKVCNTFTVCLNVASCDL